MGLRSNRSAKRSIETHNASPGFAAFLRTSLAVLRDEVPPAFELMCTSLAGRTVKIEVDGEAVTLGFSETEAIECVLEPQVVLKTDARTIIDLCDAELTIARAVLSDRMHLAGRTADLIAFDDGLAAYLAGAVRAPSFPALLDDYRTDTDRSRT